MFGIGIDVYHGAAIDIDRVALYGLNDVGSAGAAATVNQVTDDFLWRKIPQAGLRC